MVIEETILPFLRIVLVDNRLIFLQVWSISHFFVGFILWKFFKVDIKVMLLLIIGFELFEQFLPLIGNPETTIDMLWDIIAGISGYLVAKKDFSLKSNG